MFPSAKVSVLACQAATLRILKNLFKPISFMKPVPGSHAFSTGIFADPGRFSFLGPWTAIIHIKFKNFLSGSKLSISHNILDVSQIKTTCHLDRSSWYFSSIRSYWGRKSSRHYDLYIIRNCCTSGFHLRLQILVHIYFHSSKFDRQVNKCWFKRYKI